MDIDEEELEEHSRVSAALNNDLREAAKRLAPKEARYLCDMYYQVQDYRKATENQIRAQREEGDPVALMSWVARHFRLIEPKIKTVMKLYAEEQEVGRWSLSILGIGPVIAGGLLAHIDIHKAPYVGHIWSFAGLSVGQKWEKGHVRPWNARLKVLAYHIGESFCKVSNRPADFYGKFYRDRKQLEEARNEQGLYADTARRALQEKKWDKSTPTYATLMAGKLSQGHLDRRAKRYATKIFLSHWHWVAFQSTFGKPPKQPWAVEKLGHLTVIPPPNWPMKKSRRLRRSNESERAIPLEGA